MDLAVFVDLCSLRAVPQYRNGQAPRVICLAPLLQGVARPATVRWPLRGSRSCQKQSPAFATHEALSSAPAR